MEPHYAELVGVAAAAASLYAAHAKTIIPLRVAAIVANLPSALRDSRRSLTTIPLLTA
jgi:hypothetical protein